MNGSFMVDIFMALNAIALTTYLIYARYNPRLIERVHKRHTFNVQAHKWHHRLYSPQFLAISSIATGSLALGVAVDILESISGHLSSSVKLTEFVIRMVSGLTVIYLLYILLRGNKR